MTLQAKIFLPLYTTFCLTVRVYGGGEHNGRGVLSVALANSTVASIHDVWSLRKNPAGLSTLTAPQGGFFLVPEQFGLKELKTIAFAVGVPLPFGTAGIGIEQFGFSLYREMTLSLAMAGEIDWGIAGGFTVNLHRFSIERYGSTQVPSFDLGLAAELGKDLRLGCAVQNISGATIGKAKDPLPQLFHLGLSVVPLDGLRLSLGAEKDIRFPITISMGVEQALFDFLSLRGGVANAPERFAAGLAVRYSMFEFGYAGYSHPFLGWTHQIEIGARIE
jgi:hypothetical protein